MKNEHKRLLDSLIEEESKIAEKLKTLEAEVRDHRKKFLSIRNKIEKARAEEKLLEQKEEEEEIAAEKAAEKAAADKVAATKKSAEKAVAEAAKPKSFFMKAKKAVIYLIESLLSALHINWFPFSGDQKQSQTPADLIAKLPTERSATTTRNPAGKKPGS